MRRWPFDTRGLPLVVEPDGAADAGGLAQWLRTETDEVRDRLRTHGALLFRGFDVSTPEQFEAVARAVDDGLQNEYLGTSPRDAITDHVFSASELPSFYPIPQHCEMSFLREPPRRVFFWCRVPPRSGGETPLVDFRRVYREMDPAVRRRFEEGGIRVVRNYSGPQGGGRHDLWKLKRWDEMFLTTDRAAVEAACREQGFEATWRPGGRLRLVSAQPAVREHPETGEPVWFSHAQVFHLSSAPQEYRRIFRRTRDVRSLALWQLSRALVALKRRTTAPLDHAMHCTYGDGREIPDGDMDHLRGVIWRNMVAYRWRRGDVVAIDNRSVSHGRLPYRGRREVAVCWA